MKKSSLITIIIIIAILAFSYFILTKETPITPENVTKCIGENSVLYTQLGCHYCEVQEKMFGDNYHDLTIIDCFFEKEKCLEIQTTPTWIINGEKYRGVQSIEKLQELTGC